MIKVHHIEGPTAYEITAWLKENKDKIVVNVCHLPPIINSVYDSVTQINEHINIKEAECWIYYMDRPQPKIVVPPKPGSLQGLF